MAGGGGNDTFRFDSVSHSTPDSQASITDFTLGDRIDLSRIDAKASTPANDAFSFIGNAAFSNTAGELRFEHVSGNDWLVQGDVDGDGVADLEILVTIPDSHPLTAGDFIL